VPRDTDAYRDLGIGQDLGKLVPEKGDRNIEALLSEPTIELRNPPPVP